MNHARSSSKPRGMVGGSDAHSFLTITGKSEIEAADQTFYLTQSQHTDTGPTSSSTDPVTPGAWQSSHWSANFEVTGMTLPRNVPSQAGFEPGSSALEADALTTRPTRRSSAACCLPHSCARARVNHARSISKSRGMKDDSDVNLFLTITGKSRSRHELFYTLLVHVHAIPNLQKRCTSLSDRHQGKTLRR